MATQRQKLVLGKMLENTGASMYKIMRAAGYSEAYAKNPKDLVETRGFQDLLNEAGVTDERIAQVMSDGLGATKPLYKNNNKTGQIELVAETPDHTVRHKYLETAIKAKGHISEQGGNVNQFNTFIQNNTINPMSEEAKSIGEASLQYMMDITRDNGDNDR